MAFSPDGRYLVTGRRNGAVQVWDARTGQPVGTLGTHDRDDPGRGVQPRRPAPGFGERRRGGQTVGRDPPGPRSKKPRHTLAARVPGPSLNVAFSPDGRRLATGGEENTVKIWDVQTGQELHTLRGHSGDVYTVAFSPDGRWVASAGEDSTVKVWDSHTGELRPQLPRPHRPRQQPGVQPRRPAPGLGKPRSHGQGLGRDATGRRADR